MMFDESVEIDAPASEIFRISQDYAHRLDWDPFLRSAELIDAPGPGVGVRALCISRGGWSMETEYVSYNPPRAAAVKMTKGPWLLRAFAGSWRFDDCGEGRTRAGFRYSLETRPSALSWFLTPIVAFAFARDSRRRLRALKAASEAPGRRVISPTSRPR